MTEEQKLWVQLYSTILAGVTASPDTQGYTWEKLRERAKVETNMAWHAAKECGK